MGVVKGEAFSETEVRGSAKVALIGRTVKENLFGDEDPIGQIIRIKNVPFMVNGVLSEKGQSSMGQDQDDVVIVPITTAQKKALWNNPYYRDAGKGICPNTCEGGSG